MVKKLLKHEFIYYIRTFILFLPIVLVIGVMARIFRCFDNGKTINNIIIASAFVMLAVACGALLILSTVSCVVRFYKNLYTAEGYLSFTLPVTNHAHIFVKLLAAMVCETVCSLTAAGAVAIALPGEALVNFFRDFAYGVEVITEYISPWHIVGLAVECLVMIIVTMAATLLQYYSCITIGQMAKKHRILAAVGVHFAYYMLTQIVGTVAMVVLTLTARSEETIEMWDRILYWIAENPLPFMHIYLCFVVVLGAGLAALFWFITQKVMTKKLNLE